jgi:hypothetical protein
MLNLLREKNSYYINSILVLYIIYPHALIIIEKLINIVIFTIMIIFLH